MSTDNRKPNTDNYNLSLYKRIKKYGDRVSRIDPFTDEVQTFKDIHDLTVRLALAMKDMGLKKGDPIVVCGRTSFYYEMPFLAALYLGVIPGTASAVADKDELSSNIELIQPKVIFADSNISEKVEGIVKDLGIDTRIIYYQSDEFKKLLEPHPDEDSFEVTRIDNPEDDIAFLVYTSGTTGRPKGVPVTHHMVKNFTDTLSDLPTEGLYLYDSVLSWISGIKGLILCMHTGLKRILLDYDDHFQQPDCYLRIIEKYKVNYIVSYCSSIITFVNLPNLDDFDRTSVKLVYLSGSTVTMKRLDDAKRVFPNAIVDNSYGSTELFMGCTVLDESCHNGRRLGYDGVISCGKLRDCAECKILDLETQEIIRKPNTRGDLYLKLPTQMRGYYKNEEKTRKAIDSDGFYYTGDVGYVDEENYLYIIGRKSDMVLYDDHFIFADELQDYLELHPAVQVAAVMGVPHKSLGALPKAFVQKTPNVDVTEEELIEFVNGKVDEDWKKLRGGLKFVEKIPLTSTAKVKRHLLLKWV